MAAVRTFAKGVNTEFTVMPMSLICSHFCKGLPSASSVRAIRKSGRTLLICDGFYLHLTEDPICEAMWTLVGLMTLARVVAFLGL